MGEKPTGYYIPIHKSLILPLLMGGIPKNLCLAIWSCGVAIGVMLKMYWFFIFVISIHLIVLKMTKNDPDYFETLVNHLHDKHYFDV